MRTITVRSPANIAFIKYWGQIDPVIVLPQNESCSMNLSACYTDIEFTKVSDPQIQEMEIREFGHSRYRQSTRDELTKVTIYYERIRTLYRLKEAFGFRIRSVNSFPQKAGIASSASFFSALAYAFMRAFSLSLSTEDLSILARLSGSGSACRSVPDGFVWWKKGHDNASSHAYSFAAPDAWDIVDIVLVLNTAEKQISSIDGHAGALSSPYYLSRQRMLPKIAQQLRAAFEDRAFERFGTLVEQEAMNFHSVLMTQSPPLFYWSGKTIQVLQEVVNLRKTGTACYSTIDAGENVHLICQRESVDRLVRHFKASGLTQTVLVNYPAVGTHEI
ncbi:MAG: diphosphomevalonate decarboxylase [Patescibacteria group bacterium]